MNINNCRRSETLHQRLFNEEMGKRLTASIRCYLAANRVDGNDFSPQEDV